MTDKHSISADAELAGDRHLGRRCALGGVMTLVALALALNVVLGAVSVGVMDAGRLAEGVVARCAAVSIVRATERARERDQDVPARSPGWAGVASRSTASAPDECSTAPVLGSVGLARVVVGLIDLPPPARG